MRKRGIKPLLLHLALGVYNVVALIGIIGILWKNDLWNEKKWTPRRTDAPARLAGSRAHLCCSRIFDLDAPFEGRCEESLF